MKRQILFVVAGCGLLAFLAMRWLLAEPTISVDFTDAPLARVLAAYERQGKIALISSVDPDTPVTIQTKRAPVSDAMDLLAARLDGDWRGVYIVGPDSATLRAGREAAASGRRSTEGWRSFRMPGWGEALLPHSPDPRKLTWNVERMDQNTLSAYLDQGSQKLPVQFFVPEGWDPTIGKPPGKGSPASVATALARSAGGRAEEVFLVTGRQGGGGEGFAGGGGRPEGGIEQQAPGDASGFRRGPDGTGDGFAGRGQMQRENLNPAWIAERTEALISALPPEERRQAREMEAEFRQLRERIEGLGPEERRDAMREYFSSPEVQERFEEAMAIRDTRRSPEQRQQRYRRTADRRIEKRQSEGNPLVARP